MTVANWLRGPLAGMFGWPPIITTNYYNGPSGATGTLALVQNTLYVVPFEVGQAVAIDRIGVQVTAGVASSFVRVGVYTSLASGLPGALLFDAGQLDASAIAAVEATITRTLPHGLVWFGAVAQGGTPTVRTVGAGGGIVPRPGGLGLDASSNRVALTKTGQSGALPASFGTPSSVTGQAPAVLVRGA